jgi:enoyl-CoA hydratase/carnithine racemase
MPRYESPYDPSTMPQKLEHVIYEKKGHVAYVTINRPEVRNALHSYAYAELRACWRDIGLDPDIYVGIVTGAGEAFCAGRDVKFLASYQAQGKRTPHEDPNNPLFHWGGGGQPSDSNLEKPLIAAMNGFAVGVGLSLALQCQLRVMADTAWIGDTHTKVGRLARHTISTPRCRERRRPISRCATAGSPRTSAIARPSSTRSSRARS